ncbi:DEAD/DEAH box helicase family protein [Gammaproteobacteria bacterium]|nr:DEAD/DEAH box helicase family protein [Gammaproteobacteria bacterium]
MIDAKLTPILPLLSRLPAHKLQDAAGSELVDSLREYKFDLDNHSIAEVLLLIYGFGIFEKKELFSSILSMLGLDDFRWGNNKSSRDFAESLDLDAELFFRKKISISVIEEAETKSNLHSYQIDIKNSISRMLLSNSEKKSLMVQMPTGAGKTRVAMESIYDLIRVNADQDSNMTILWLAHTDELCEQAIESFQIGWENIGTTSVNYVRLWGNVTKIKEIPSGVNFVVCSFQSAYSMLKTQHDSITDLMLDLRSRLEVIFIDEAHMAMAETFEQTIDFFSSIRTKKVGLSATPGRDGIDSGLVETRKLSAFFEDNIIDIGKVYNIDDPILYLQEKNVLSEVFHEPLDTGITFDFEGIDSKVLTDPSKNLPSHIIKEIASNSLRNKKIIDHILYLAIEEKKKILVFAISVAHANLLSALLNSHNLAAQSITSDSHTSDRRENIRRFKDDEIQILINYNILSTGFDAPKTDCIVIARPTFSVVLYSQMIGRGLRGTENGGTKKCKIVNVVDNILNQPGLNHAYKYFEEGWNND